MALFRDNKILITGASGFLGQHVIRKLREHGAKEQNLVYFSSNVFDLRNREACLCVTKDVGIVMHLAGNVGGIQYNQKNPGTLLYDNAIMGLELMEAARVNKVKKFVTIGTVCSYPKFTPVPFSEEDLWSGYPEETNAPYGLAKKLLLAQGQAYRQEYGFNSIHLIPVNLYGPGDNFSEDSSHVIPALIKKVANAKNQNQISIEVWGTGQASREFLYVEDAAEAIVLATELYDEAEPVNIGSGKEITIRQLVETICQMMQFDGEIFWNVIYPDGQPRRCLDVSRAKEKFGFEAKVSFELGLQRTIGWYLINQK